MVKILEFNDLDIPNEILPKPDFDVPADLLVFMRNDPLFYRKNFFPAVEEFRQNKKNTKPLENMINRGFDQYCTKFNIENPREEIFNIGDVKRLVAEIIADEMQDLEEGIMDRVRGFMSGDPLFKAWKRIFNSQGEQAALRYLVNNKSPDKHNEFKAMIGAN